jgi:hypothetical protein
MNTQGLIDMNGNKVIISALRTRCKGRVGFWRLLAQAKHGIDVSLPVFLGEVFPARGTMLGLTSDGRQLYKKASRISHQLRRTAALKIVHFLGPDLLLGCTSAVSSADVACSLSAKMRSLAED